DETGSPYSMPLISNVTYIGAGMDATPAGDGNDRALYFRDNAGGKYWNSIFTDFTGIGLKVEDLESGEDSRSRLENGDLLIENNIWWDFGAGNTVDDLASDDFVADHLSANDNQIVDPQLKNISRISDQSLDPRPNASGPAASGATIPEDDFFADVEYYGAFQPGISLWTQDWTALSSAEFTNIRVEEKVSETIPEVFHLAQNFPNPFNPTTTITYEVPKTSKINLTIYNTLGEKVITLVDEVRGAGVYTINVDASTLASGIYFYRLKTDNFVQTRKMMLMK
ncbi:MAG: T9SS type A sorting domain-containing protein, partial [Caldithrix sp.]|nr:T9SS type A sorting domain-containing protein [Caldithrix sp.]